MTASASDAVWGAPALGASLTQAPPPITPTEAEDLARRAFGVTGSARPLRSERDENFLIHSGAGDYVLKVINPAEPPEVSDFHARALLHAEHAEPDLPVPRLVRTCDGEPQGRFQVGGGERVLQLLTFLPGKVAAEAPRSRPLRAAIGAVLARFDAAFRDFRHPASDHPLSWDLKSAARLNELLPGLQAKGERALAEAALEAFAAEVEPMLPQLRAQVIHNDFNLHNVLVGETSPAQVVGLIDFGDMIWAPLVNDLAIAMSYHVAGEADPLAGALELAKAYHDTSPLEPREADLLFDLIRARMAMTVLITDWRARRHPENAAYITKNRPSAIAGLTSLSRISREEAQGQVRRALGLEAAP